MTTGRLHSEPAVRHSTRHNGGRQMSYLIDVEKIATDKGYDEGFGTQCVALVKKAPAATDSANPPQTSLWRPGIWVHGAQPGTIKKGTVIATFLLNKYPLTSPRHAAVYVSH